MVWLMGGIVVHTDFNMHYVFNKSFIEKCLKIKSVLRKLNVNSKSLHELVPFGQILSFMVGKRECSMIKLRNCYLGSISSRSATTYDTTAHTAEHRFISAGFCTVIVSPSVWWNQKYLLSAVCRLAPRQKKQDPKTELK